jgi:uncharacterized protein with PIN domain
MGEAKYSEQRGEPGMSTVIDRPGVIERPEVEERLERKPEELVGDAPPIFGRCPVCQKPLRPRCKTTGEPKCPPVGTGYESRAKCGGCGTILVYLGDGKWRPMEPGDYTEEDAFADRMGF